MERLITVFVSKSLADVYSVQAILEIENISSFRKDEYTTQITPYLTNGIQIQVKQEDIFKAVEILQRKGYITAKVSKESNTIKQSLIFIVSLITLLFLFLWLKKNI